MTSNTDVIWVNRAAKAILLIRILVGAPLSWSVYPSCLRAPAYRHLRGFVLNQDRHVREERVLGHAARSAHGCQHAAWPDFPTDCRRRNPGPRCALPGRVGPKVMRLLGVYLRRYLHRRVDGMW